MKLFKKLAIALTSALCAVGICLAFAACGESNPDANLAEGTYVFYVYLDDGTTPAEGTTFAVCLDTSASESVCLVAVSVDKNGRGEVDLSSYTIYNGGVYFHFGLLPDGYSYPSDSYTVTLADGSQYTNAYKVTSQISTYTLTKA